MKYFSLSPEVAGGLGANTVMDRNVHPPIVTKLHYQFDGWLGDDLLESFPVYIATEHLAEQLRTLRPTGVRFAPVEVSTSEQFRDLYPDLKLPPFVWLKIDGKAGMDDFGISGNHELIVSERVMLLLRSFNIAHCDITEV